jgi:hypothetical protein
MRKKILGLLAITLLFGLVGCEDVEYVNSGTLTEKAVVVTLIHSPSEHNTELTETAYDNNVNGLSGLSGTDYNGNRGIKVGKNLQVTTTTIPERFGVAFQCSHGTFTVEGSEIKHRVLYDKMYGSVDDTVTILYVEQYRKTYETIDGVRKLISNTLYDLDFIDAQK